MAIMHVVWPVSALYGGICVLVTYLIYVAAPRSPSPPLLPSVDTRYAVNWWLTRAGMKQRCEPQNKLSCSLTGFGWRKCSVVRVNLRALSLSFSQATSKRRPIIQA